MSEDRAPEIGRITWTDLTVDDAERVRDFYTAVVGWKVEPVGMGDYDDFSMLAPASGEAVAGVCHKRGMNAAIPSQWLVYITVADLDQSIARCEELGGEVISPPKDLGSHCLLYTSPSPRD